MRQAIVSARAALVFLMLFFVKRNSAQDYCGGDRFIENVFSEAQVVIQSNIKYGEAIDYLGVNQNLKLDMYAPSAEADPLDERPLIMFMHGGGLVNGSKESEGATELGVAFARLGYVFASIDYRLGWDVGCEECCNGVIDDYYKARYRAVQDAKAAYRFLKSEADTYGIDTNYMFIEGNSAGSNVILYAAYASQEDFPSALYAEFGSIDSSSNELFGYSFDPKGLIFEAAGIEDTTILFDHANIPTLFFHGTCDSIVPYFHGPMFSCYSPVLYPELFGSWELVRILKNLGQPYHFYSGEGGSHDVAIPDTVIIYAKTFLKEILCDDFTTSNIYRIVGRFRCAVENNGELFIEPVYPNPVNDQINITVSSAHEKDVDLFIYNSIGEIVQERILDFYPPINSYTLDVADLPRGIYYIVVSQRQEVYLIKFMK